MPKKQKSRAPSKSQQPMVSMTMPSSAGQISATDEKLAEKSELPKSEPPKSEPSRWITWTPIVISALSLVVSVGIAIRSDYFARDTLTHNKPVFQVSAMERTFAVPKENGDSWPNLEVPLTITNGGKDDAKGVTVKIAPDVIRGNCSANMHTNMPFYARELRGGVSQQFPARIDVRCESRAVVEIKLNILVEYGEDDVFPTHHESFIELIKLDPTKSQAISP